VAENSPVDTNRSQRALAYGVAASIVLSLIAIALNLGFTLAGAKLPPALEPIIVSLPVFGLPLGFILIIVLLFSSVIQRGRAAKDARN
jgi:hypothetical protein